MRGDAYVLVECNECHSVIEVPLLRAGDGQWESWNVNGYLARQGWVSDPIEHGDFCGPQCLSKATKGRKPIEVVEGLGG